MSRGRGWSSARRTGEGMEGPGSEEEEEGRRESGRVRTPDWEEEMTAAPPGARPSTMRMLRSGSATTKCEYSHSSAGGDEVSAVTLLTLHFRVRLRIRVRVRLHVRIRTLVWIRISGHGHPAPGHVLHVLRPRVRRGHTPMECPVVRTDRRGRIPKVLPLVEVPEMVPPHDLRLGLWRVAHQRQVAAHEHQPVPARGVGLRGRDDVVVIEGDVEWDWAQT